MKTVVDLLYYITHDLVRIKPQCNTNISVVIASYENLIILMLLMKKKKNTDEVFLIAYKRSRIQRRLMEYFGKLNE